MFSLGFGLSIGVLRVVFHCFPLFSSAAFRAARPGEPGSLSVGCGCRVFSIPPAKCVHLVTLVAKVPMVCNWPPFILPNFFIVHSFVLPTGYSIVAYKS